MSSFRTIELSDPQYEYHGLRFLTIKTPNLKGRGDICLYVPRMVERVEDLPIYILLHGVYGSAWAWAWKGGAHLMAQHLIQEQEIQPAIIAMPSDGLWGDGSAYFAHHDRRFDDWIVSDVPKAVMENIPHTSTNSPICIGGLSMGGYGALALGVRFPGRFRAISAHSAITKLEQMEAFVEEPLKAYQEYCETPDIVDLVKKCPGPLPKIRFDCGINDPLIEPNRQLHSQLVELNIPHSYQEFDGGHEWPYWQKHLEKTLRFFDRSIRI